MNYIKNYVTMKSYEETEQMKEQFMIDHPKEYAMLQKFTIIRWKYPNFGINQLPSILKEAGLPCGGTFVQALMTTIFKDSNDMSLVNPISLLSAIAKYKELNRKYSLKHRAQPKIEVKPKVKQKELNVEPYSFISVTCNLKVTYVWK